MILLLGSLYLSSLLPSTLCQILYRKSADHALHPGDWTGWGGNIRNNRWVTDSTITSANIGHVTDLIVHGHGLTVCKKAFLQGVSVTPTFQKGIAYFPSWDGNFYAIDYISCKIKWTLNVTQVVLDYAPVTTEQLLVSRALSRTSPQIDGNVLHFGTQIHALIVAIEVDTGTVLDVIQVNPHPHAVITMSPTFYKGTLFVGASSGEEIASYLIPGYPCCSFIGNVMGLTFKHGKYHVGWNLSTISSDRIGWAGAAVWGSQPSIDVGRNTVFFATGNVYLAPDEYVYCEGNRTNTTSGSGGSDPCLPKDVWQESVIALDIDTGNVKWIHQLTPLDAWILTCGLPPNFPRNTVLCPIEAGPDADFGMAPAFVPGSRHTPSGRDVVVLGQKNGNLYAIYAETGEIAWSVVTSPDSPQGGLSWGVAVDEESVYFTAINGNAETFQLQPSNLSINNSAYGAVSLIDGSIRWETQASGHSVAYNPPTVVNDIVLTGRSGVDDGSGNLGYSLGGLVALNKATGAIILDTDVDTNFHGGIAVLDSKVIFGTGYRVYGSSNSSGSLWVVDVDRRK